MTSGAADAPPPRQRGPRLVVALRVVLLLVAAAAVGAATRTATHRDTRAQWVCPMHQEVRAPGSGACPICGMALQPVATAARPDATPALADLAAVENVRRHNVVDFVRRRTLLGSERELRAPARVDDDGTIVAVLYRDQVAALARDERGTFEPTARPGSAVAVRRAGTTETRWDDSTSQVRFRPDARGALRPGTVGWLTLAPRPRPVVTVPASAVLHSPAGPYVLVAPGGYAVEKRPVALGETFLKEGFAVVLAGVRPNERVVARAAVFLDADRRLNEVAP